MANKLQLNENFNVKIINICEDLTQGSGNSFLPYQMTIYKHVTLSITPPLLQRTHGVLRSTSNYQKLERMKGPKRSQNSSTNLLPTGIINTRSHRAQEKTLSFYCHRQRNTFARKRFPLTVIWKINTEIESTRNISPHHPVLPS
jgi:hypothetical protein